MLTNRYVQGNMKERNHTHPFHMYSCHKDKKERESQHCAIPVHPLLPPLRPSEPAIPSMRMCFLCFPFLLGSTRPVLPGIQSPREYLDKNKGRERPEFYASARFCILQSVFKVTRNRVGFIHPCLLVGSLLQFLARHFPYTLFKMAAKRGRRKRERKSSEGGMGEPSLALWMSTSSPSPAYRIGRPFLR